MTYNYITTTGVIVPDTADLRAEVEAEWRAAFGDIATSADTPQGVMITGETLAREALVNNNAALANQINPNQAGGVFLDAICALVGIERRPAAASRLYAVTLGGVTGTQVPAGTLFTDVNGRQWASTSSVTLTGSPATADVDMACTVVGPVGCSVGDLVQVFTPVLGLETVYNTTAATLGYLQESDIELATRRRVTLARQGISTAEAQISALNDITGVTAVAWRENIAATVQTIDGIVMAPHSIWACVDGGDTLTVATAIWTNKTNGAAFNGAVVQPVTDPHSGQTVDVLFDRPTHVPVSVEITGRLVGDQSINPLVVIPQAVVTWAAGGVQGDPGLGIGTDVSPYEVGGAVNIAAMTLRRGGVAVPVGTSVAISMLERAVIGTGDVTVITT
jgi:hypothetical protein